MSNQQNDHYNETVKEATNESMLCDKCKHFKEDHYWNGAGNDFNSGYDACHVCGCVNYDWDNPKLEISMNMLCHRCGLAGHSPKDYKKCLKLKGNNV